MLKAQARGPTKPGAFPILTIISHPCIIIANIAFIQNGIDEPQLSPVGFILLHYTQYINNTISLTKSSGVELLADMSQFLVLGHGRHPRLILTPYQRNNMIARFPTKIKTIKYTEACKVNEG